MEPLGSIRRPNKVHDDPYPTLSLCEGRGGREFADFIGKKFFTTTTADGVPSQKPRSPGATGTHKENEAMNKKLFAALFASALLVAGCGDTNNITNNYTTEIVAPDGGAGNTVVNNTTVTTINNYGGSLDGGAMTSDTGSTYAVDTQPVVTTSSPTCNNSLKVEYVRPFTSAVSPGTTNVQALIYRLTPSCADVTVSQSAFQISAIGFDSSDPTPYYSQNNVAFFQNIRVATASTGQVVMGPVANTSVETSDSQAYISLRDDLTIRAGEPVLLVLTFDVSSNFTLVPADEIFYQVSINYIDAGVPMNVVYDSGYPTNPMPRFSVKK